MKKSLVVLGLLLTVIAGVLIFKKRMEYISYGEARNAWELVKRDTSMVVLRRFINQYPASPQAKKARQRLDSLETEQEWKKALAAGTREALQSFAVRYPKFAKLKGLDAINPAFAESEAWKETLSRNTPQAFQEFLKKYPQSAYAAKADSMLIALEVGGMISGAHDELPDSRQISNVQEEITTLEIDNQTPYQLVVRYSGKNSRRFTIEPKGKITVKLENGRYRVAANAVGADVLPFAGEQELAGGEYVSRYFIRE
ncbi:MAG: hypothetical protein ONA69_01635 [candidate division KSB1 bacterium]|nr:hypothetical protein [candidate division KSB1 bacterium]MDZ7345474.1 hypothetical protein [candidate division KSB1 bacterium]